MSNGICIICKKKCSYYNSLCNTCFKNFKINTYKKAEIEFEEQYKKTDAEPVSKIFEEAEFEVYHTYVYDKLSEEEYKEKVEEEFTKLFFYEKLKQLFKEYNNK